MMIFVAGVFQRQSSSKRSRHLDIDLWNSLSFSIDYFTENRSHILLQRYDEVPGSLDVYKRQDLIDAVPLIATQLVNMMIVVSFLSIFIKSLILFI